jgi:hypothetical protein
MKVWGYIKNEKLGKNDNGLVEPIILEKFQKNLGLGCTTSKVTLIGKFTSTKWAEASSWLPPSCDTTLDDFPQYIIDLF